MGKNNERSDLDLNDIYQDLVSSIEILDGSDIKRGEKTGTLKSLPFVTIALMESQISDCIYTSEVKQDEGTTRLKAVQTELASLCDMITSNPSSFANAVTLNDKRLVMMHANVVKKDKTILFVTYHTHSSLTEEFKDDLAFLKDVSRYIQRKSDMYDYEIKTLNIFGTIYHVTEKT